jgi:O-antigen/teichoic acid export membrane protein/glycosyltransferase involved in cell wall biosynthesis
MGLNTSWALAGNAAYAGAQWAVLILLVKALPSEEVGSFVYGLALTGPIFVLASVRLRNLLATGVPSPAGVRDYLLARATTTVAALLVSVAAGVIFRSDPAAVAVIALVAFAKACDAMSEIAHGLFQRELDMRTAAIGLMWNGGASVLLVALSLVIWPTIQAAAIAYAAGSLVALVAWDWPRVAALLGKEQTSAASIRAALALIGRALPLGLSSAIGSLQTNLPRYVVASSLGPGALAIFGAVSYIPITGHLAVNAVSQAALPLLARNGSESLLVSHWRRLGALVAASAAFGAVILAGTALAGPALLGSIYGAEYAEHSGVLLWLMGGAVVSFASVFLGTGTTARGRYKSQLGITAWSFAVVAISIGPLTARYGLNGAAGSLLAAAIAELIAYAVLTIRDLRETAPARVRAAGANLLGEKPIDVLHVFGVLDRGGAEMRAVELAEYFPRDRVRSDFVVLTGRDGALDTRVEAAGGQVIKCRLDARFPLAFYRLLRARRYDVVHSHVHYFSGVVLALARAAGVPGRVAHLHTAVVHGRRSTLRRRAQLALCRSLLQRMATNIVACGEGTMDVAWTPRWSADPRCRVIYFGVRSDRLQAARCERGEEPTIVNVASVQPLKNQARLISVLRRLADRVPGVQLRLVGREVGDYGDRVRRAAAEAGLADRVRLVGEVAEPMPLMASAHLMILPSLWEGLPCAVLEACAVGTPVLASDLPGTRELARHFPDVHLLSLQEDDEAWADAAERIIHERRGASSPPDRLANSPFAFERSCEALYEVWSHAHA